MRRFKHYTSDELSFLRANYYSLSREELAQKLGRTLSGISLACHKLRLVKRNFNYENTFSLKKALLKPHFIYFLGFFWADGYFCKKSKKFRISSGISYEDGLQLKDTFLEVDKFKVSNWKNEGKKDTMFFSSANQEFTRVLFELDFMTKSFDEPRKILSLVPENLHYLFWRGFFDGDGCIVRQSRTRRVSFCGQYDYKWECLIERLSKLGIKFCISNRKTNYGKNSTIIFWRKADVDKFFSYIYPCGYDFGLKRKYDKFFTPSL